ncbi:unnamed protein product [Clonostachys chloroleuca]|uniref:Heterokaryon incompatibility domain-containing protein n=1 Tax=Clonostachys chloroleuca TaxID=1926264 RepID=A0AA35M774_9HYPO|nr:unnamed protein product [Clonostachys chloroleuca]
MVRPDVTTGREIPDHTGHEAVAQLAKEWHEECKKNHACGDFYQHRQVGWYPKRLVHVGQDGQRPRLVLRDEDGLHGPYATLCHCWSEKPEFFMLNAYNLEDLRKETPIERLATSFRHAILTCQRLQIPYVWIDSLCILQAGSTSQSDWLFHANEMHKVYLNCELNIAIDVSANPHEGAFRQRNPCILQDCFTWTPFHGYSDFPEESLEREPDTESENKAMFDPQHRERSSPSKTAQINLCALFTEEDFSYSRLNLPLSQRAWVFQEAILSARILHFGSDRIWWACAKRTTLSECMPNSVANNTGQGFDCLYQSSFNIERGSSNTLILYFEYLTKYYTDRELSHPREDKLVAFAVIARLCAPWFGGDYCAGIFRNIVPWGLLWYSHPEAFTPRPDSYRAPSWSWASIDNRVFFDFYDREPNILAHVLDVSVQLVDISDPFGQVKSAALTLRGPLISSQALIGKGSTTQSRLTVSTLLDEKIWLEPDDYYWSFRSSQQEQHPDYYPSLGRNLHFLCIGEVEYSPVFEHKSGTYGLILRKSDNGSFLRVGRWVARVGFIKRHAGTDCELQAETIAIL